MKTKHFHIKTKEENTMSKENAMKFMAEISKGGTAR